MFSHGSFESTESAKHCPEGARSCFSKQNNLQTLVAKR